MLNLFTKCGILLFICFNTVQAWSASACRLVLGDERATQVDLGLDPFSEPGIPRQIRQERQRDLIRLVDGSSLAVLNSFEIISEVQMEMVSVFQPPQEAILSYPLRMTTLVPASGSNSNHRLAKEVDMSRGWVYGANGVYFTPQQLATRRASVVISSDRKSFAIKGFNGFVLNYSPKLNSQSVVVDFELILHPKEAVNYYTLKFVVADRNGGSLSKLQELKKDFYFTENGMLESAESFSGWVRKDDVNHRNQIKAPLVRPSEVFGQERGLEISGNRMKVPTPSEVPFSLARPLGKNKVLVIDAQNRMYIYTFDKATKTYSYQAIYIRGYNSDLSLGYKTADVQVLRENLFLIRNSSEEGFLLKITKSGQVEVLEAINAVSAILVLNDREYLAVRTLDAEYVYGRVDQGLKSLTEKKKSPRSMQASGVRFFKLGEQRKLTAYRGDRSSVVGDYQVQADGSLIETTGVGVAIPPVGLKDIEVRVEIKKNSSADSSLEVEFLQ